jgi:hypothetical protein
VAAYTLKQFAPVTTLGTSASTLYTATAPVTNAVVKQLLISNYGASSAAVTVYLVPSGGTPGTGNVVVPAVAISANSTITLDITQVLNTGGFISALASTSSAINIMISGYEVTA